MPTWDRGGPVGPTHGAHDCGAARHSYRAGPDGRNVCAAGRAAGRLPAGAKGDEATVEYRDGVLTVSVPVPETKTGTRTIPVHHV
ncbi:MULTISPECIES: Hsp20 family protein [unclassified Streptomyces]|uniref:Hsp20 family protein n=1 Tax=unclassified Streptomyces TaxID=2593676 RepID=UPI0027B88D1D|nr:MULTISPECIES: Hsp20 family protein [unclassified Streptomyces]